MKKDFEKLKFNLLLYRHIYAIYAVIIAVCVGLFIYAIHHLQPMWYLIFQGVIIIGLGIVAISRLAKERLSIETEAIIFLGVLTSLKEGLQSRITKLMVLENEFDVLKEKSDGVSLIQERLCNIQLSTISESIHYAEKICGKDSEAFITSFKLPSSLKELDKLIRDMRVGANKDMENVSMMYEKISKLFIAF
jgi:hypothetical protein